MNGTVEFNKKRRNATILITFGMLIMISFILSMNTGYMKVAPIELFKTLFGQGTAQQQLILFDFRLPRIVISVLIGAGLAVSGCIMQSVSRNALADPGILGINAGAGLMVMIFVSFFSVTSTGHIFLLPVLAFVGAGLTATLIFILSYQRNQGISPNSLLLTGIGVAAGISAAMVILTIRLKPDQYQFVASWLAGSIWGTNWKFVITLLPWILILIPYLMYKSNVLNIISLGEERSIALGISVQREQIKLLIAAVALAAACVSVSGGIGFVGLIGPHLARRLVGSQHNILLPTAALAGSLLVIVADMLGRVIMAPAEIATGVVVAVIGAPYFIYLLIKMK